MRKNEELRTRVEGTAKNLASLWPTREKKGSKWWVKQKKNKKKSEELLEIKRREVGTNGDGDDGLEKGKREE